METSHSISQNQNNKQECGRFYWLPFFLRVQSLLQFVAQVKMNVKEIWTSLRSVKNFRLNLMLHHALVDLAGAVLDKVWIFISTGKVNGRLLVGLILVGIFTPIADVFYTFLPEGRVPESEWYYESWYWLFLCLGPYISVLFFSFGLLLIVFPKYDNRVWFFLPPLAFALAKILWLCFVSSHDEYLQVPPLTFYLYAVVIVGFCLSMSNYLAWRKYHRSDAHERRMDGLCQIANMNDPIQAGFVTTWKEMKATNY